MTRRLAVVTLTAELMYWQGRARQRYGRSTPWRLGCVVGVAHAELTNPYDPGRPSHRHFEDGVLWGRERAARLALDDAR